MTDVSSTRRLCRMGLTSLAVLAGLAPAVRAAEPGAGVLDTPAIRVTDPARVLLDAAATIGKRIVAGGEHGVIAISDDDGRSWRQAAVPVSATITNIVFVNATRGWAVGHFGVVLRSDDAGEHWQLMLDGTRIPKLMLPADDETAASRLKLAQRFVKDGPDKPLLLIHAQDADRVQAFGADNLAVESRDGGATWKDLSTRFENPRTLHLYGVVAQGERMLIAGEQGLLVRGTLDAGLHKAESPYDGSFFGAMSLGDASVLVYGLVGHGFISHDFGASWTPVSSDRETTLSAAVSRADGSVALGDVQGAISVLSGVAAGTPALTRSALRAPWPIAAMIETPSRTLLAFGLGGVARFPAGQTDPVNE